MNFWDVIAAITLVAAAGLHFRQLTHFFSLHGQFRDRVDAPDTKQSFLEFLTFAKAYYDFAPALQERVKVLNDSFLREVISAFLHGGLVGHDLLRTLRNRVEQKYESDMAVMHDLQLTMRGLPIVGWAVAIASAIWMFNSGSEPISFERAATAFSVSMAGVLYGVGFSYLVVMPLMEKIWRTSRESKAKNAALVEGLSHLIRKKSVFELYETVQVLLPEDSRPQWSEVFPEKMKLVG